MSPVGELVVVAAGAAGALFLALPGTPRLPSRDPAPPSHSVRNHRARDLLGAAAAGIGAALLVGGPAGPVLAVLVAGVTWHWLGRREPAAVRRERERSERDLPVLVHLLGAALRTGAATAGAVRLTADALPGPGAERIAGVADRLDLGADPAAVFTALVDDPVLAPLGRCLLRSHESGAPVADAVERLAGELEEQARAGVEERARTVGVRAAVPLGVCLLPSFLLLGIVPLAVGLMSGLG